MVEPMGPTSLPAPRKDVAQLAPVTPASTAGSAIVPMVPVVDPAWSATRTPLLATTTARCSCARAIATLSSIPTAASTSMPSSSPNRGDVQPGVTQDGVNDQRPATPSSSVERAPNSTGRCSSTSTTCWPANSPASRSCFSRRRSATSSSTSTTPWANIQIGQFDAPFTLENRTVDKYIDFMERSITVRSFAVPMNKEIGVMLHGMAPQKYLRYELGIFNGDGGNVRNPDNHFDVIGRAYFAPWPSCRAPVLRAGCPRSGWAARSGTVSASMCPTMRSRRCSAMVARRSCPGLWQRQPPGPQRADL